jgi:sulfur-oxidizing protein SoxX
MKKIIFLAILSTLLLQGCKTTPGAAPVAAAKPLEMNPEKLMTSKDPGMGNCLACHAIPSRPELAAGTIAPPFIGMKQRFPDIAVLRAQIADQKKFNPQTMMPPFGRNKILTPEQIDVVAQYIYQY